MAGFAPPESFLPVASALQSCLSASNGSARIAFLSAAVR